MIKLKKGDIIETKGTKNKFNIVAVADGAYLLRLTDIFSDCDDKEWYSDSEIEAKFILPKEKWVPDIDEQYFYFENDGCISDCYYANDRIDLTRIDFGNCFETEAEAEQKVEEIRKILEK